MADHDNQDELERQFRAEGADRAGLHPEGQMLAYRGKKGCDSIVCDHRLLVPGEVPDPEEECLGFHCARCHGPCGPAGHNQCPEQQPDERA